MSLARVRTAIEGSLPVLKLAAGAGRGKLIEGEGRIGHGQLRAVSDQRFATYFE